MFLFFFCVYDALLSLFGEPHQWHRKHGWLTGRLPGWLAGRARLQFRIDDDCLGRSWSTGTRVVLPRSWTRDQRRRRTWVLSSAVRYVGPRCRPLVTYCTIKCGTGRAVRPRCLLLPLAPFPRATPFFASSPCPAPSASVEMRRKRKGKRCVTKCAQVEENLNSRSAPAPGNRPTGRV